MFDIEHPWDFFKEIFVLNLPHRTDRKEHMRQHLSRFPNLNYSFFNGIYGKDSKYIVEFALGKNIIKLIPDETGEVLNIGQVACIVSHYLIWQHCLLNLPKDSKGHWILVLEDDAEFHPDFNNQILYDYLIQLPKDAKYFKMGYQFAEKYSKMSFGNAYWNKLDGCVFSTIAYAIHTDFLMPFLAMTYSHPLDWYPVANAYGMVDIHKHLLMTSYEQNNSDPYFSYDYHFSREGIIYKHTGVYGGVLRSFKYEVDSDINFFAQQLRLKHSEESEK